MTKSLWIILIVLWILLGLWFCNSYICNNNTTAPTKTTQKVISPPVNKVNQWTVRDGSGFGFDSPDFISFGKSSFASSAIGAQLAGNIGKLATYLKGHTDRGVTVTGRYGADEINNSILPTLGLARANDIKSLLQSKGVSAGQIEIADELVPNIEWANNRIADGIDIDFGAVADNNDRLDVIKKRLSGKPIILYFGTNQDQISLTAQQRKDFADLNYYLDRVAEANLSVDGHTDNAGNRDYNVNLSLQRSIFVRDYLQKNGGINANRMTTQGYGPDKPVSSNATNEGKAKNRRVEVTLN